MDMRDAEASFTTWHSKRVGSPRQLIDEKLGFFPTLFLWRCILSTNVLRARERMAKLGCSRV